MTGSLLTAAVAATDPTSPVTGATADLPLSVQARDYPAALAGGAQPVDIRSAQTRATDGALFGALAIDAADVLDRLTPGGIGSLRLAADDARWVLISDDGYDAEWLAWHLQARGIHGARFVVGGHRALLRARATGRLSEQELAMIAAH